MTLGFLSPSLIRISLIRSLLRSSTMADKRGSSDPKGAKKDHSTAILERKKSANRLFVDEVINDNNSVIAMHPDTMERSFSSLEVPLLRNLEYIACYYITGSYKTQDYGYCIRNTHYRDLAYAVSFLPYYWRAMQCARRWFDEGQATHLVNLGKYVSAMLAAGAKLAYEKEKTTGYLCLVVAISSGATVYQLYWDYVKDWGLLQFDSKNPWLRNELMLRQKFIYYFSMALNLILRLAWLQTVLHPNFGNVDCRVMGLFLAALEIIRRGQWNFFRLENEHLNNAGKFRAVKQVPLPFHEVDEED